MGRIRQTDECAWTEVASQRMATTSESFHLHALNRDCDHTAKRGRYQLWSAFIKSACNRSHSRPAFALLREGNEILNLAGTMSPAGGTTSPAAPILIHKPPHAYIHYDAQGQKRKQQRGAAITHKGQGNAGHRHKADYHADIHQDVKS